MNKYIFEVWDKKYKDWVGVKVMEDSDRFEFRCRAIDKMKKRITQLEHDLEGIEGIAKQLTEKLYEVRHGKKRKEPSKWMQKVLKDQEIFSSDFNKTTVIKDPQIEGFVE
jgi:hypothetical protein